MKTVETFRVAAGDSNLAMFADTLRMQLLALMPELAEIKPVPKIGSARGPETLGRTILSPVADPFVHEMS